MKREMPNMYLPPVVKECFIKYSNQLDTALRAVVAEGQEAKVNGSELTDYAVNKKLKERLTDILAAIPEEIDRTDFIITAKFMYDFNMGAELSALIFFRGEQTEYERAIYEEFKDRPLQLHAFNELKDAIKGCTTREEAQQLLSGVLGRVYDDYHCGKLCLSTRVPAPLT